MHLFAIGIGMLVLAIRLWMVQYMLGHTRAGVALFGQGLLSNGALATVAALVVVVLVGVVHGVSTPEFQVIAPAGGTVMLLGLSWMVQGVVQMGRGTQREVRIGVLITAIVGVFLIIAYCLT